MNKKEVLIVLFLALTLASIAVSNIDQMGIDAEVAKAKADLRSIGAALESYEADNGKYPPDAGFYGMIGPSIILFPLTTPVPYLPTIPPEVFPTSGTTSIKGMQYGYVAEEFINSHKDSQPFGSPNPKHYWSVASLGPDRMGNWGVWSAIYGIDGIDFSRQYLVFVGDVSMIQLMELSVAGIL